MRFFRGLLLAGAAALALAGCGTGSTGAGMLVDRPTATPSVAAEAPAADGAVSMAVVGDSITAIVVGSNPEFGNGTYSSQSWLASTVDDGHEFAGGWAEAGARTTDMRAGVYPVTADVLVMLAGTNDVLRDEDRQETLNNLVAIAATVGADNVLVLAIPPIDGAPELAVDYNDDLEAFAAGRGWSFFDAAAELRDGDSFVSGFTVDGVHPTSAGQKIMGAAVRAEIDRLAADWE